MTITKTMPHKMFHIVILTFLVHTRHNNDTENEVITHQVIRNFVIFRFNIKNVSGLIKIVHAYTLKLMHLADH